MFRDSVNLTPGPLPHIKQVFLIYIFLNKYLSSTFRRKWLEKYILI